MNNTKKLCAMEDCDRPSRALGYCVKHYSRLYKHGRLHLKVKERVEKKCLKCGKIFEVIPCRGSEAKYCSRQCYWEYRRKYPQIKQPPKCIDCGKDLHPQSRAGVKRCRPCHVLKGSTIFREPDHDDAFGHWLSGFTDGEGNFHCSEGASGRYVSFAFRIILREDDKGILEKIRDNLGVGNLVFRDVVKGMPNWNPKYQSKVRRNQWCYIVYSAYDLSKVIVPHFDKYPLRAKKAKQYEIWKERLQNSRTYLEFKERGDL